MRMSGKMKDLSLPVSSNIRTTAEIGPCVVADKTAQAPSNAKNPIGTPGQSVVQGPYVAETIPVTVEEQYVVVDL